MIRPLFFISAVLFTVAAGKVSESSITKLATFDGAASTTYKWKDLNDPVMGGVSTSTWAIDKTNFDIVLSRNHISRVSSFLHMSLNMCDGLWVD